MYSLRTTSEKIWSLKGGGGVCSEDDLRNLEEE